MIMKVGQFRKKFRKLTDGKLNVQVDLKEPIEITFKSLVGFSNAGEPTFVDVPVFVNSVKRTGIYYYIGATYEGLRLVDLEEDELDKVYKQLPEKVVRDINFWYL